MFFLLRNIFSDDDLNCSNPITEEEFGYVINGIDSDIIKIKINSDIEKELNDAIKKDYSLYTKAIIHIKSKTELSDEEKELVINTIKDKMNVNLNLNIAYKISDIIDYKMKAIIIASK